MARAPRKTRVKAAEDKTVEPASAAGIGAVAAGPAAPTEISKAEEALLKRIEEISRNARTNWFAMLGALVFAGITLMGVKDIDFFGVDRNTQLPLLNVTVPVTYFFGGGATLIAAIYIYLHLYLEMLWPELAQAPAQIAGKPLMQRVYPWLISEWALRWRDMLRSEPKGWLHKRAIQTMVYLFLIRPKRVDESEKSASSRPLSWIGTVLTLGLVWAFGPLVLAFFWWQSAVAHDDSMTLWLAFLFGFSTWIGLRSFWSASNNLAGNETEGTMRIGKIVRQYAPLVAIVVLLSVISLVRTGSEWLPGENVAWKDHGEGNAAAEMRKLWRRNDKSAYWNRRFELARPLGLKWEMWADRLHTAIFPQFIAGSDLNDTQIAIRPDGWLDYAEAKREFRSQWAKREGLDYADPFPATELNDIEASFKKAWEENGETDEREFRRQWAGENGIAYRKPFPPQQAKASREKEFDEVWNIRRGNYLANLKKPVLDDYDLKGANLEKAFLPDVFMRRMRLQGANLSSAVLEGADFTEASLEGAKLTSALLEGAHFSRYDHDENKWLFASLEGADLSGSRLKGAFFSFARLEGADLSGARLEGADLSYARLKGADLSGARLEGADLSYASLEGAFFIGTRLEGAFLIGASLFGTKDRTLDMSSAATLKAADFSAAAMRVADLSRVAMAELNETKNFILSFGDASVKLPDGYPIPCQWANSDMVGIKEPLNNEQYFGRWRGWLIRGGAMFLPNGLELYAAIEPPAGCEWPAGRQ